jgi:iron-sulfur cluster assembly enzyme ISCU, mitochondrial
MLSRTVRAVSGARALATPLLRPSYLAAAAAAPRQLAPAASTVAKRHYHEKVLDRESAVPTGLVLYDDDAKLHALTDYSRPRNVGSLDKADSSVGTGLVGAPAWSVTML